MADSYLSRRTENSNHYTKYKIKGINRCSFLLYWFWHKSHYENVPFEIPESWCWTTIDELLINRDSERVPLSSTIRKKQVNKVYEYYGAAGVIDKVEGYLFNEKLLLIGEDGANLLSRSKDNAFFADGKYWVNNHAHVLDCCYKSILTYVAYLINSISLEPFVTGTAQPKLSQDNLNKIPIALPPIKEQARIVAGIEKWVGFIDEIEAGKIELESYIKQTKSKILELAISGKLVPQDPNDEPAIELLKRINPGFEPCDNSHYENLPQGWAVCRLNDMVRIQNGFAFQSAKYIDVGIRIIRITNVQSGYIIDESPKFYPHNLMVGLDEYNLKNGDLLMSLTGNVGRVGIMPENLLPAALNQRVCCIKPKNNDIDKMYLFYYFQAEQFIQDCIASGKGVAQLNVSTEWLKHYIIQLPPKEEQSRIVKTIDALFSIIDKITAEL